MEQDIKDYEDFDHGKIAKIIEEHLEWLNSNGEQGNRAIIRRKRLNTINLFRNSMFGGKPVIQILNKLIFDDCIFQDVTFSDLPLKEVIFKECILNSCSFPKSRLDEVEFINCEPFIARFEESVLTKVKFKEINNPRILLQGATLFNVDLSNLNLNDTVFGSADIHNIDVSNSSLERAKFTSADLTNTNFRNSVLIDANFLAENNKRPRGFSSRQLGGSNLTGATLPEEINKFEGLEYTEKICSMAKKIFSVLLLSCVYCILTIVSTTDEGLIKNSAESVLPIIGTKISIAWFYWAAPFILLCIFIYYNIYLQRLWETLSDLPAYFPDGNPLDKKAYPWFFINRVRIHFKLLKKGRPAFRKIQNIISIFLAWWVIPITIGLFWYRYLNIHDYFLTIIHALVFTLSIFYGVIFWWMSNKTLQGLKRIKIMKKSILALIILVSLLFYSYSAIEGKISKNYYKANLNSVDFSNFDLSGKDLRRADFTNTNVTGTNFVNTNLRGADLTKTLEDPINNYHAFQGFQAVDAIIDCTTKMNHDYNEVMKTKKMNK